MSNSPPKGATELETLWERGPKSTDLPDRDDAEEALLTQPLIHWKGDRETVATENGEMANDEMVDGEMVYQRKSRKFEMVNDEDRADTNTLEQTLTQEDNLGTHATI